MNSAQPPPALCTELPAIGSIKKASAAVPTYILAGVVQSQYRPAVLTDRRGTHVGESKTCATLLSWYRPPQMAKSSTSTT